MIGLKKFLKPVVEGVLDKLVEGGKSCWSVKNFKTNGTYNLYDDVVEIHKNKGWEQIDVEFYVGNCLRPGLKDSEGKAKKSKEITYVFEKNNLIYYLKEFLLTMHKRMEEFESSEENIIISIGEEHDNSEYLSAEEDGDGEVPDEETWQEVRPEPEIMKQMVTNEVQRNISDRNIKLSPYDMMYELLGNMDGKIRMIYIDNKNSCIYTYQNDNGFDTKDKEAIFIKNQSGNNKKNRGFKWLWCQINIG